MLVIICVSLDITLNKPRCIGFQCATCILLCLHLLIQYVSVDMRWQCLLEVLLLILEVVTGKVFVVICVVEEVSMARVELEGVLTSCIVVLSIAIVHVV